MKKSLIFNLNSIYSILVVIWNWASQIESSPSFRDRFSINPNIWFFFILMEKPNLLWERRRFTFTQAIYHLPVARRSRHKRPKTSYNKRSTRSFFLFVLLTNVMAARGALLKYLRVNVSTLPRTTATNLFSLSFNAIHRRFSEEVRGSFLDKSEVTDRVISVVKNFQKVDPSKVSNQNN